MKNVSVLIFGLIVLVFESLAQSDIKDYKRFRVVTSIGYATGISFSPGIFPGAGIAISVEPAFTLSNRFFTGIRFETASVSSLYEGDMIVSSDFGTIIPTLNYYLSGYPTRWFAGGGIGLFALIIDERVGSPVENKPGLMLRTGFHKRHLQMATELNLSSKSEYDAGNSYLSVKIGVAIGGGRKK